MSKRSTGSKSEKSEYADHAPPADYVATVEIWTAYQSDELLREIADVLERALPVGRLITSVRVTVPKGKK